MFGNACNLIKSLPTLFNNDISNTKATKKIVITYHGSTIMIQLFIAIQSTFCRKVHSQKSNLKCHHFTLYTLYQNNNVCPTGAVL